MGHIIKLKTLANHTERALYLETLMMKVVNIGRCVAVGYSYRILKLLVILPVIGSNSSFLFYEKKKHMCLKIRTFKESVFIFRLSEA